MEIYKLSVNIFLILFLRVRHDDANAVTELIKKLGMSDKSFWIIFVVKALKT